MHRSTTDVNFFLTFLQAAAFFPNLTLDIELFPDIKMHNYFSIVFQNKFLYCGTHYSTTEGDDTILIYLDRGYILIEYMVRAICLCSPAFIKKCFDDTFRYEGAYFLSDVTVHPTNFIT